MGKLVAYLAISLDGYIATEQDDVSWLEEVETDGDAGYREFYSTLDRVVMGRRTYDWICEHTSEYPYQGKTSYIITSKPLENKNNINVLNNIQQLTEIKKQPGEDIWVIGGGKLISSLINQGLLDQLRVTISPILLGKGIPLFSHISGHHKLRLYSTATYGQFTELRYNLVKNP